MKMGMGKNNIFGHFHNIFGQIWQHKNNIFGLQKQHFYPSPNHKIKKVVQKNTGPYHNMYARTLQ